MKKVLTAAAVIACVSQHVMAQPWPECSMLPNCRGETLPKQEQCFLKINCNEIVV